MKRAQAKIVFSLAVFAISFGVLQILDEDEVLAQSRQICCNAYNCNGQYCTTQSQAYVKPDNCGINDWIWISCRTCVDYNLSGCLCTSGSTRCKNADESYYYGSRVDCPAK